MLCYTVVASEIGPPWLTLKGTKMRSAVQVLREMSLIKANTKGDPVMQKALLGPLQDELKAIAAHTEAQGKLALDVSENAKKGGAK